MNNHSGNSSYDGTPVKDTSGKVHQQAHGQIKREPSNPDTDNATGNNNFGSNVPPFPFHNDQNELNQHYGPPGNGKIFMKKKKYKHGTLSILSCNFQRIFHSCVAYPRMTPPTGRPASVPTIPPPYHHPIHVVSNILHFE